MQRSDFHFELPAELVAKRPTRERSASRLLVLDGRTGAYQDRQFRDLPDLLRPDDLLVLNDTRVVPARIHGRKDSGGKIEILLERVIDTNIALVQARASKGLRPGAVVRLPGGDRATMLRREDDLFVLQFSCNVLDYFAAHGLLPLPPYLERQAEAVDQERYQTVYARNLGAVAAPTAGLHFDADVFAALEAKGVRCSFVTLHVGAGTFQSVRAEDLAHHVMHEEYLEVSADTVAAIIATRARGGRVIAVGTTVVRSLETAAAAATSALGRTVASEGIAPYRGTTRMFITPGYRFRIIDAMVTNFHLPESTLLMLCCAFVGREAMLDAYSHAIAARYRFFSYGDAMFLSPMTAARHPP